MFYWLSSLKSSLKLQKISILKIISFHKFCIFVDFHVMNYWQFHFVWSCRKSLKAAKKVHEAHESEIKALEDELAEVERAQEEFEENLAEESKSKGRDLTLQDSQVIIEAYTLLWLIHVFSDGTIW